VIILAFWGVDGKIGDEKRTQGGELLHIRNVIM
jgi:hypothetical protein